MKLASFFPVYKFQITGDSMSPTLSSGAIVLVNRLAYLFGSPKVNDIVAVKDPRDGKFLIKRITGIENNSAKQNAKYFVEGDNTNASTDSRKFGMLERKDILGKVLLAESVKREA